MGGTSGSGSRHRRVRLYPSILPGGYATRCVDGDVGYARRRPRCHGVRPLDGAPGAEDTAAMTTQRALTPAPIAPWAEIVPGTPPMTVDELHAIPDDGWTYELLQGVLARMPLRSFGASNTGSRLLARLSVYVEDNGLGAVTSEQGGYRLDPAHPLDTEIAPDIAFVRAERVPSPTSPDYYRRAPQLAPDLAVEVASENTPTGVPGSRRGREGQDLPCLRDTPGLGDLAPLQARGCVAPGRRDAGLAGPRRHARWGGCGARLQLPRGAALSVATRSSPMAGGQHMG